VSPRAQIVVGWIFAVLKIMSDPDLNILIGISQHHLSESSSNEGKLLEDNQSAGDKCAADRVIKPKV